MDPKATEAATPHVSLSSCGNEIELLPLDVTLCADDVCATSRIDVDNVDPKSRVVGDENHPPRSAMLPFGRHQSSCCDTDFLAERPDRGNRMLRSGVERTSSLEGFRGWIDDGDIAPTSSPSVDSRVHCR